MASNVGKKITASAETAGKVFPFGVKALNAEGLKIPAQANVAAINMVLLAVAGGDLKDASDEKLFAGRGGKIRRGIPVAGWSHERPD